jgi:hypothetical protein
MADCCIRVAYHRRGGAGRFPNARASNKTTSQSFPVRQLSYEPITLLSGSRDAPADRAAFAGEAANASAGHSRASFGSRVRIGKLDSRVGALDHHFSAWTERVPSA